MYTRSTPLSSTIDAPWNPTERARGWARRAVWTLGRFDRGSAVGTIGALLLALKNERGREMIDCRTAAERYGCSMRYIRKLVEQGKLKAQTAGGTHLVDAADVDRLKAKVSKGKGRHKPKADRFKPG